jgi:hypothetical protein
LAVKLEQRLEKYKAPKDLPVHQGFLDIFRDESDFTGPEYRSSLAKHLEDSAALIVLCSPDARQSLYVNDEIRRFAQLKGTDRIIPILVRGIPNNEATPKREAEKAFPEALCDVLEMPLAANYLGFDPKTDKIDRGPYFDSWSTLLANLYGVSRSEIEQRERKRRARFLSIVASVTISVVALLVVALIVTLISRSEAVQQAIEARRQTSTRLAIQALEKINVAPETALDLAIQAVATYRHFGDPPVPRAIEALHRVRLSFGGGRPAIPWRNDQAALVFSTDLVWVATSSRSGEVRFSRTGSGQLNLLEPPPAVLGSKEQWSDRDDTKLLFAGRRLFAARLIKREDERSAKRAAIWFWPLAEDGITGDPKVVDKIDRNYWDRVLLVASPDGRWLSWTDGRNRVFLRVIGTDAQTFSRPSRRK